MIIYNQEKLDGLSHLLEQRASVTYASVAIPCDTQTGTSSTYFKSIASVHDEDLYYVQSILVSSSWNKNDDIFDKAEIWKAKNTPEDKPTNLEHDEHTIIGHIVANWPITEEGILIDDNTPIENLPEKYHILTGSVIYKGFSDPNLKDRSISLISEIEQGLKYVSMECFFKGFDYGLINKETAEYHILRRNENTAYLTKFLRSYGGIGEHQNYKIGRVLRNITFSGKGFVNKPANEDSIIFSKNLIPHNILKKSEQKNEEIEKLGVLNFQPSIKSETLTMSSIANQESETPTVTTEATVDNSVVVSELTSKIEELTIANNQLQDEIKTLTEAKEIELTQIKQEAFDKLSHSETELNNLKATIETLRTELNNAEESVAAYKAKEVEMMKKEKKQKRVAALLQAGVNNDVALATVDKFENLDDEAFDAIATLCAAKKDTTKKDDVEEDHEVASGKASLSIQADPSVLETAEVETDVNLSVGSNDAESALESTRAALVEFVCSKLGKKTNK